MTQGISTPPFTGFLTQQPSGRLYLNSNQSNINSGVPTKVLLDTIDPYFTDAIEDVPNNKIPPGVAGFYIFTAAVCWESILDQKRYDLAVILNPGAVGVGLHEFCNSGTGLGTAGHNFNKITDVIYLTALQSLELQVNHTDGTNNPAIIAGRWRSFLTVQRVR